MALRKSTQAAKRVMAVTAAGAFSVIPAMAEHVIKAGEFALNDVLEMIPWPAGTAIHSLHAQIEDADTGTTLTLDFGVLSGQYLAALDDAGAARTCGTQFGAALTTGQAGGSIVATPAQMLALAPSALDRSIGFKVAAAATGLTAGAKLRVSALFVPVPQGVAFA